MDFTSLRILFLKFIIIIIVIIIIIFNGEIEIKIN